MWQKIKDLREKSKNKYIKAAIFFGFYFIFFIIIFILSIDKNQLETNNDEHKTKDKWRLINNNYQFLYEIMIEDSNKPLVIKLEGKKYNHKQLIDKYINNQLIDTIYIYYDEVKIKENNTWHKQENYYLVDEHFNHHLIDLNYFKEIVKSSILIDKKTNFDESVEEYYRYQVGDKVIDFRVLSQDNLIRALTIDCPFIKIYLQYKDIDKITDFFIK